jgi:hypothetical protein
LPDYRQRKRSGTAEGVVIGMRRERQDGLSLKLFDLEVSGTGYRLNKATTSSRQDNKIA